MRFAPFSYALLVCAACTSDILQNEGPPQPTPTGPEVVALRIEPETATLVTAPGVVAEHTAKAIATFADGSELDVSTEATMSFSDYELGIFFGPTFRTTGDLGGAGTASAYYGGAQATATIEVHINSIRVADGAPDNAADLFAGATEDANLAPTVIYPDTGTVMPPNLGDFEVHWGGAPPTNLTEVHLTADYVDFTIYTTGSDWAAFSPDEWQIIGRSSRSMDLDVEVATLDLAAPSAFGRSATSLVHLTDDDMLGGLYYWTTQSQGEGAAGIFRHDMSRPQEAAEEFFTTNQTEGRCVGCHSLSRDGTKMAVRFGGGLANAGSVVDVKSGTTLLDTDGTYAWNFAAFEPDGKRVLFGAAGAFDVLDVATGDSTSMTTQGLSTQPDFSPAGDKLVYVRYTSGNDIWFTGGKLVTRTYDLATGTAGPEVDLTIEGASNNYYPTWSPDGEWILFNRSAGDSYNDADAEVWIVKADGSTPAVKLDAPNLASGLTNSWARWAPFAQTHDGEPVFWLTFSSTREFGVRLEAGRPQLWMAPFYPERASAGTAASAPAFRLPFQDLESNNHIAQWTEQVVDFELPNVD